MHPIQRLPATQDPPAHPGSPASASAGAARLRPAGRPVHRAALAALLCAVMAPAVAGSAKITWVEPERFADIGRNAVDRERVLASLAGHLERLAARLPDGQTLQVEVTDVDLAGEVAPYGRWSWDDVRVLRGSTDWPRVSLRWTLRGADGGTLRQGQDDLSDSAYLFRPEPGHLGHEKRLLQRWFGARFETR